jgi:NAD(P)-dependent dehydrogenase (short-subunit alcohol dehydrogenase family)
MSRIALDGRTAVVIGGTSGIGRTMAAGLARAGANVVATGRRTELVDEVASEIEAIGVKTLRQPTDVEDRASLQALHDAVARTLAPVDILINCAGRTIKSPTIDVTEEDWHAVLETNLHGTLRACQVFGRPMIGRTPPTPFTAMKRPRCIRVKCSTSSVR